ncbi:MAG: hypothetical protein DWQ35_22235, partial [Planctomycetota bacterium]
MRLSEQYRQKWVVQLAVSERLDLEENLSMTMPTQARRLISIVLTCFGLIAITALEAVAAPYMELAAAPVQLGPADDHPGMWEYVYDVHHAVGFHEYLITLQGFEADSIVNLHDTGSGYGMAMHQMWDTHVAGGWTLWGGFWDKSIRPSYWSGSGLNWQLPSQGACVGCANEAYEYVNQWHHPFAYNSSIFYSNRPGELLDLDAGISGRDAIRWSPFQGGQAPNLFGIGGLGMTFRVVHPNAPGTIEYHFYGSGASALGEVLGPAPVSGPTSCNIGDVNCDGFVEIGADILTAFTNFTGPGSFGKVRATGDVHGPSVATTAVLGHDGDVDVSDILTIFGAFTGPPPDEGSGGLGGPAEAGDPSIPDLIYDAATGEVTLDADGSSIIGYSLQNATNSFLPAGHTPILAGVTTALTSQLEEAALAP